MQFHVRNTVMGGLLVTMRLALVFSVAGIAQGQIFYSEDFEDPPAATDTGSFGYTSELGGQGAIGDLPNLGSRGSVVLNPISHVRNDTTTIPVDKTGLQLRFTADIFYPSQSGNDAFFGLSSLTRDCCNNEGVFVGNNVGGDEWTLDLRGLGGTTHVFGTDGTPGVGFGEAATAEIIVDYITNAVTASVVSAGGTATTTQSFTAGNADFLSGVAIQNYSGGFELDNIVVDAVPEPSTLLILGIGGLGLIACRRWSAW